MHVSGSALAAAVLAAIVAGLLWAAPAVGVATKRDRFVALLLGLDTGAVLLTGIAIAAAAGRSWMLVTEPADPTPTRHAMLQVSRLDGDGDFFALLIVVIGLLTLLATVLVGTAARCVPSSNSSDRAVVRGVLWVEVVLGLYGIGHLLLTGRAPLQIVLAAHLPLTVGALTLLQRHRDRPTLPPPR